MVRWIILSDDKCREEFVQFGTKIEISQLTNEIPFAVNLTPDSINVLFEVNELCNNTLQPP